MATLPNGTLLNSGGLDVKPRTEADVAKHRAELLARAAKVAKNPTPLGDVVAAHYQHAAKEIKQSLEWRLQNLRDAIVQSRKAWRSLDGRVYQLNQEQRNYIVSWRTEMLNDAFRRRRAEARRYAELRGQLRDLTAEGNRDLPVVRVNLVETVES